MPELEDLLAEMGGAEITGPAPLVRPPLIPGEQRLSEPTEDDAVLTDILREMAAPPPRGAIRRALAGAGEAMLGTPGKIAEGVGIAVGSEGLTELGQSIQPTPDGILPYVQPGEEGVAANLGRAGGSGLALAPLAALGPVAGAVGVGAAATAQAIPDAFYSAKAAGEDDDEAYRAALATAIPQGLIEGVLGPERMISKIAGAMAKADKVTGGAGRALLVSGLGEGTEEAAQSLWGDLVAQTLYDEAPDEDWKTILGRAAESAAYGAAGGLMLGSVALAAQRAAMGRGGAEGEPNAQPEPAQPVYSPLERDATPEEEQALERWKADRKATRAEFVERPEAEEAVALARKTGATVLFVDDDAAGDAAIEGMEVGRNLIILPAKADPATALLATATHESVHTLPEGPRAKLVDDLTAVFPKEAKALAERYKARAADAGKKVGGETLKEESAADLAKALAPVVRRVMTDRATAVRVMGQRPGLMIRVLDTVRGAFGATKIADRMQKELDTLAEVRDEIAAGIDPRKRIAAAIRIVKAYDGIKAEMSVPIRIRQKQEAVKQAQNAERGLMVVPQADQPAKPSKATMKGDKTAGLNAQVADENAPYRPGAVQLGDTKKVADELRKMEIPELQAKAKEAQENQDYEERVALSEAQFSPAEQKAYKAARSAARSAQRSLDMARTEREVADARENVLFASKRLAKYESRLTTQQRERLRSTPDPEVYERAIEAKKSGLEVKYGDLPKGSAREQELLDEEQRGLERAVPSVRYSLADDGLNRLRDTWAAQGVTIDARTSGSRPNTVTLSRIIVPEAQRGQGIGTKAMQDLVAYADANGQRIALSPSTDFGGSSVGRLRDFYKRFGFKDNAGRSRDFSISESMIREPNEGDGAVPSVRYSLDEGAPKVSVDVLRRDGGSTYYGASIRQAGKYADMTFRVDADGTAFVGKVSSPSGPNAMGPGVVRAAMREIQRKVPSITRFSGDRISGSNPLPMEADGPLYSLASEAGAAPDEVAAARKAWKEQGTESPWFKRWFGASKVVDGDGKPLIVYHGTNSDFNEFAQSKIGEFGPGIYLTSSANEANTYAGGRGRGEEGASIKAVYVQMRNPYRATSPSQVWEAFPVDNDADLQVAMQEAGYDGIELTRPVSTVVGDQVVGTDEQQKHYVVWNPTAIKSATGNIGTFDPANPDIRYSLAQTTTPEFKRWFGASKITDSMDRPKVVYHGTGSIGEEPGETFTRFNGKDDKFDHGRWLSQMGDWFTDSPSVAGHFADMKEDSQILPVYLRIKKPFEVETYADLERAVASSGLTVQGFADKLKRRGYDGIIIERSNTDFDVVRQDYVVFDGGAQIKSATGNSGAFDPENPDIRYSIRSDIEKEVQKVAQGLGREGYQLANAGETLPERGLRAAVRSMMAPEYVPDTETEARVQRILNDPQARTDVLAAGISGEPLNTEQTVALDRMAKAQAASAWSAGSEEDMGMAQATEVAFQQQRTEQARTMGTGLLRDSMQTPMERAMKLLLTPSRKVQRKLAKAETWQARRAILREEAKKVMEVRYALAERGFDPRLITDDYFKDPEFRSTWARAVADAKGGSPADWYISWRRASMLSAPITAIRNLSGNTAYTGYDRVLRLAADAIVPGSKTESGDVAEYVKVLLATFPEAWSNARDAYRDFYVKGTEGTSLDDKANLQGGKIRTAVEGVGIRVNVGTDAFFKTILGAAEIRLRSRQMARAKGGVAEDYEHDPDVLKLAKADMERALFLDRDKLTRAIVLARDWADEAFAGIPVGSTIVPFASTPTQLVRRSGEALLGPAAALWRKEEKGGTALLGLATWAAMIWAASLFDDDDGMPILTGSSVWGGEGEFQGRTAPAYSMRIGDSYYSYKQIQPLSMALASIVDGTRKGTPMESIGSFVKAAKDQSFFQSIETIWDAVQGVAQGERGLNRAGKVARELLWTPMIPNVIRSPIRSTDEVRRKEIGDPFEQRDFAYAALPIAALGPPLKHDLWGRPVQKEGGTWVARVFGAMPMTQAVEHVERVDALLGKYYSTQEKPSYFDAPETYVTRNKQRIDWTEEEYSTLTREAGTRALERIRPWVAEKDTLTKGEVEYIGKVISATRAQVANELLQARNPE